MNELWWCEPDCWGTASLHSSYIKAHLVFPCQSLVSPRSADPLQLTFILAHGAAGISAPEGLPSGFPSGFWKPAAGDATPLPNPRLCLRSLLVWRKRQFLLASAVCFLPPFTAVSSLKRVTYILTKCSQSVEERSALLFFICS